tara:strand:+ start:3546 stop:4412 length:867 start_codon:yes stop_codon:yes gene_type:complete
LYCRKLSSKISRKKILIMSIVSTHWTEKNLDEIKIIDCSWHMPNINRNGYEEYLKNHIENAIFFDLDNNSNQKTDLPHMLTDIINWEKIISNMGINNNDNIVIYDNSDVLSACRCWYNFIYFGHNPKLVHILDGGLKKWVKEGKVTTNRLPQNNLSKYIAKENKELVKNKIQIDRNIKDKNFFVVDARSRGRFEGKESEPRKGLKSGSIPDSFCIPFNELINEDHSFKNKNEIKEIFKKTLGDNMSLNVVFSCGSGVTASVLALAYSLINNKYMPIIYDGSWAEYGRI